MTSSCKGPISGKYNTRANLHMSFVTSRCRSPRGSEGHFFLRGEGGRGSNGFYEIGGGIEYNGGT